jgi:hypothetical protein
MSPRREDYTPHVVLPKIGSARPPSNRSFLPVDLDPNDASNSSEYRLCFANYHPKRPYVFHAQPSHVFDYVPMPPNSRFNSRLVASQSFSKANDTEYQQRYPNYPSYIPTQELLPPHLSAYPNMPSYTQQKRERMARSQHFHQLVTDDDKYHGGKPHVGTSEQRTAFQWPQQYRQQQQQQKPATPVYPPYHVPRNIYEPLPALQRPILNTSN